MTRLVCCISINPSLYGLKPNDLDPNTRTSESTGKRVCEAGSTQNNHFSSDLTPLGL